MIFRIKRKSGSQDILDLDVGVMSDKLAVQLREHGDPLELVMQLQSSNDGFSKFWPEGGLDCKFFGASKKSYKDVNSYDGFLVLTEKAYELLKKPLNEYGEFLPLNVESIPMFLFNPLIFVEEDKELTEMDYEMGFAVGVKKLVFKPTANELLLFQSQHTANMCMYCNSEFKDLIEQLGLEGLHFDKNIDNIY